MSNQDEKLYCFLKQLKFSGLTAQQKKTLRGQAIAGDLEGAKKGFYKLMTTQTRKEVG